MSHFKHGLVILNRLPFAQNGVYDVTDVSLRSCSFFFATLRLCGNCLHENSHRVTITCGLPQRRKVATKEPRGVRGALAVK